MAISSTNDRSSYAGNGTTTAFSYPYYFLNSADLVVISRNESTGVETKLVLNTDYTVTGAGLDSGGTVTTTAIPATGTTIVIYRDPAQTQDLSLQDNGPLPVKEVEKRLDKLTMLVQRLSSRVARSFRLTDGYSSPFSLVMPSLLSPLKFFRVDATGSLIEQADIALQGAVGLPGSNGLSVYQGSSNFTARTLTSGTGILVSNGDGQAGNPTISLSGVSVPAGTQGQLLSWSAGVPAWIPAVAFTAKTSSYTLTASDDTVTFDATSGSLVATLPSAVTNSGKVYTIKRIDNTANTVTVNTTSAQTLDGRASGDIVLKVKNDYVRVQSDGANWIILAKKETAFVTSNTFKAFSGTGSGNYGSGSPSITLGPGHWKVTGQFVVAEAAYSTAGLSMATGIFASDGSNTSATPTALSGLVLGDNTFNSLVSGAIGLAPYIGTAQNSCAVSGLIEIELIQTTSQTLYLVPVPNYSGSASGGSNQMITARRIW